MTDTNILHSSKYAIQPMNGEGNFGIERSMMFIHIRRNTAMPITPYGLNEV
jgi:hypothetical protein